MVEIFRTNVNNSFESKSILKLLNKYFPSYTINFDLDDCDRILRVESEDSIEIESLIDIVRRKSIEIEVIPD